MVGVLNARTAYRGSTLPRKEARSVVRALEVLLQDQAKGDVAHARQGSILAAKGHLLASTAMRALMQEKEVANALLAPRVRTRISWLPHRARRAMRGSIQMPGRLSVKNAQLADTLIRGVINALLAPRVRTRISWLPHRARRAMRGSIQMPGRLSVKNAQLADTLIRGVINALLAPRVRTRISWLPHRARRAMRGSIQMPGRLSVKNVRKALILSEAHQTVQNVQQDDTRGAPRLPRVMCVQKERALCLVHPRVLSVRKESIMAMRAHLCVLSVPKGSTLTQKEV
jgi:hypothetical protein